MFGLLVGLFLLSVSFFSLLLFTLLLVVFYWVPDTSFAKLFVEIVWGLRWRNLLPKGRICVCFWQGPEIQGYLTLTSRTETIWSWAVYFWCTFNPIVLPSWSQLKVRGNRLPQQALVSNPRLSSAAPILSRCVQIRQMSPTGRAVPNARLTSWASTLPWILAQ